MFLFLSVITINIWNLGVTSRHIAVMMAKGSCLLNATGSSPRISTDSMTPNISTCQLLNAINPILLADHPKNVELLLPSALPSASRDTQCIDGLPQIEYQLRFAQATNVLHDIGFSRRLLRVLTAKSQTHITNTQRPTTRTHNVFNRAKAKLAQAVSTYRVSQKAIVDLAPKEEFRPWKNTLLELKDCDICGPGHKGAGTSTSHSIQSWIWTAALETSPSTKDSDLNATIRVEWCKAQELVRHHEEEVELVVEEMHQTLVTFELNACEWDQRVVSFSHHSSAVGATVAAGIAAYARKQANIQCELVKVFINSWYQILGEQHCAASWLSKYPPPPEHQHHHLVSNIKLYHAASPTPCTGTPDLGAFFD